MFLFLDIGSIPDIMYHYRHACFKVYSDSGSSLNMTTHKFTLHDLRSCLFFL